MPAPNTAAEIGREGLLALALRCEQATGEDRPLNREIALAAGWCRKTPSEARRKNPAWFHPDDCRDGKVVMDSLHGTEVWREPSNYVGSLDAAMSLVVDDEYYAMLSIERDLREGSQWTARLDSHGDECGNGDSIVCTAATQALAITALALKARAVGEGE